MIYLFVRTIITQQQLYNDEDLHHSTSRLCVPIDTTHMIQNPKKDTNVVRMSHDQIGSDTTFSMKLTGLFAQMLKLIDAFGRHLIHFLVFVECRQSTKCDKKKDGIHLSQQHYVRPDEGPAEGGRRDLPHHRRARGCYTFAPLHHPESSREYALHAKNTLYVKNIFLFRDGPALYANRLRNIPLSNLCFAVCDLLFSCRIS